METEMENVPEVRWERFLPRTVLRVMVVERDDSTRNVISALLRKCSYKVTSVYDGLEAWETLKEKPQSIDLILTEVELPSISGFTLLSLVMDHHICKRIPVIMMSSHDSISTVLKCMLKGAADFLIKPIRKNELKNIWQHVWRRQISAAEYKYPSACEECPKIGATSEKTAVISPSNAYISSEQDEAECKETKIISMVEGEELMDKRKTNNDLDKECKWVDKGSGPHGIIREFKLETLCSGTRNLAALRDFEDDGIVKRAKLCDSEVPKFQGEGRNGATEPSGGNVFFGESPPLAPIDSIGSFGAGKREFGTSNSVVGKSNSACGPLLELSLLGSDLSGSRRREANGGCLPNHSSASAFSRYTSGNRFKHSLPSYSLVNSKAQRTDNESKKPHQSYMQLQSAFSIIGDDHTAVIDQKLEKVENTSASSLVLGSPREMPKISIDISGCPDPSSTPQDAHSCQTLAWGTCITGKTGSSELQKAICADKINAESPVDKHARKNKSVMEDCIGSVAVTFSSSVGDKHNSSNSMCTELNENTRDTKLVNDSGFSSGTSPGSRSELGSIRSGPNRVDTLGLSKREAALIKFRQKRKERCFEKKVRYHSRKQLAEQRPRIKGQFVRQMQADSASSAS